MKIRLALLAVFLALPGLSTGCADWKTVGSGAIDCAKQGVSGSAGTILADVIKIASGNTSTWQSDLTSLGVKVGGDVLACAVKLAQEQLSKTPDGGTRDLVSQAALQRLQAFSRERGYVYKTGGAQ